MFRIIPKTSTHLMLMMLVSLAFTQSNAFAQYGFNLEGERVYEDPTEPEFIEHRQKLKESLQKWQDFKKACQGNYQFSRYHAPMMTNYRSLMTSTVRDGELFRREFKTFAGKNQPAEWQVQWVEEDEELGNHAGWNMATVDDLYAEADQLLRLRRHANEQLSIRFDERGLLDYCFIVRNAAGCGGITKGFPSLKITTN